MSATRFGNVSGSLPDGFGDLGFPDFDVIADDASDQFPFTSDPGGGYAGPGGDGSQPNTILLAEITLNDFPGATNGTVYPVSGAPIPNGTVLIRDGVIVGVGPGVSVPAGATRLFLELADGLGFSGDPGYYDDNTDSSMLPSISCSGARSRIA